MRRCKLISPTNLTLETPILSPVEECEYFLVGKKEWQRVRKESILFGGLIGGFIVVLVGLLMVFVVGGAK